MAEGSAGPRLHARRPHLAAGRAHLRARRPSGVRAVRTNPLADTRPHRGLHLASVLDRSSRRSDRLSRAWPPRRRGNPRATDATQWALCPIVPAAGFRVHRRGCPSRGRRPGHRADRVTRRGWALFVAMAIIWGIPYLLIKIAVGELTPVSLVLLRTAIGAALLLPVAAARGWLRPIIIARRLPNLPAVGVVAASLALTAVLYAPLALPQLPRALPSGQVLLALLILGVVCTALAFLLFFALIGEVGPVRATVITYFNPAVALVLGVALLHEPFTLGAVVGFSLILLGSVLATRRTSALAGSAAVPSSSPWGAAARDTRERRCRARGSGR